MAELKPSAQRKRQAWVTKSNTQTYIQEMGEYAIRRDNEIIGQMLGNGPGVILDMPCGTGRFIELEKERGFKVVAADYSPTMLDVARQHEGVEFVQADIFDPPFESETFDAILISRLLFHYESPEKIISLLLPSLKPGGRMIFDTLNAFSSRWLASQVICAINRDPAKRLYFERPRSFQKKLEAMGLRVIQKQSAYIIPTRSYRYFPSFAGSVSDFLEKVCPQKLRVLTYWHVDKTDP